MHKITGECMKKHIFLFVLFLFFGVNFAYASDELGFNAYLRDLNTPADANAVNIYDAWAENTAYRIEQEMTDGIVIDGKNETDEYVSDGVGNVIIKSRLNLGPIINKTDFSSTTIIIKMDRDKHIRF